MGRNISLERRAEIGRERRLKTRAHILQIAFELLGREDGRATRIEEICVAAKVARGTFYNHFTSVEEMFRALTFEISHDFNIAVRSVIRRVPNGAISASFALRYYLHKTRDDPAWGWAMVNLSAGGPIFGEETMRYATECVMDGMVTEQFSVASPEIGHDLMQGATLAGMITLLRAPQPPDFPEKLVAQIMRGLGVSPTLIERCVQPPLPDPFAYLAEHGMASERPIIDMAEFLARR